MRISRRNLQKLIREQIDNEDWYEPGDGSWDEWQADDDALSDIVDGDIHTSEDDPYYADDPRAVELDRRMRDKKRAALSRHHQGVSLSDAMGVGNKPNQRHF